MSICKGVLGKDCGKEFYDPEFPDDNICDECAEGQML